MIGVATGAGTHVYIVVSKFGKVGIYDDKFRLQRRYDVDIDTDPNADLVSSHELFFCYKVSGTDFR